MTIALGLLVKEGVVLAADTQETIPNFMKTDALKIQYYQHSNAGLLVSGAGNGNYIDTLALELNESFGKTGTDKATVTRLRRSLQVFYRNHVHPFGQLPDCPSLQLLVAFNGV